MYMSLEQHAHVHATLLLCICVQYYGDFTDCIFAHAQ